MSDYIDRNEVLRLIKDRCCLGAWEKMFLYDAIMEIPVKDIARVQHERWDDSRRLSFLDGTPAVRCTGCGACLTEDEYKKNVWNFCPVCGAKMDGRRAD